jgi:hypothetical protein
MLLPILFPIPFMEKFMTALETDLDTLRSLEVIQDLVSTILSDSQARHDVSQAQDQLRKFGDVLGLPMDRPDPSEDISSGWRNYREKFTVSDE